MSWWHRLTSCPCTALQETNMVLLEQLEMAALALTNTLACLDRTRAYGATLERIVGQRMTKAEILAAARAALA